MTSESTRLRGQQVCADMEPIADLAKANAPQFVVREDHVLLCGSVSRSSGVKAFPAREVCLETGARDMDPLLFGGTGKLYSYATVHVSASRPVPYVIGYVDFDNGVRVLAQIAADESQLYCDQPVELRAQDDRWFVAPLTA